MRLAAITMVHNEAFFLPLWYRHYGAHLGPDNLFVIDHGSTDESVSETFGNRIRIARDKFDDVSRAVMVSDIHRALLRFYDVVMYTDVDEFIVPRPSIYANLVDYAERLTIETPRCCGVELAPDRSRTTDLDLFQPILKQCPVAFPNHFYCKALLSSVPLHWIPGFHGCAEPTETDADLWLFHMKQLAPNFILPGFMPAMYDAGIQGDLNNVDFNDVFGHRKVLGLHSVPEEFLMAV